MKRVYAILIILVLFFPAMMAQSVGKSKYLKPTNFQKKITIVISKKSRSYYLLSNDKTSIINLQGPGILRVITRCQFLSKGMGNNKYEIIYDVDGRNQPVSEVLNSKPSLYAIYLERNTGVPGQLRDFEIELGRGYHTIEFKSKDNKIPVAARYKFTRTKEKKHVWISYCPKQPSEPVDLIANEETVNYYRFSMEKPLKVEVNGPTQLRVLTRIENHFQMKGRINYRVQVRENGKVINTYQLNSVRSEITIYKEHNELIPGKACEFVIDIPKGRHIFEILPLDKDKSTLLGRCLLPKKDVKLVN